MNFNICLIKPENYIHVRAFDELVLLITLSLNDLGYTVSQTENEILNNSRNIIIGCHLIQYKDSYSIPMNSIVLNTEQLSSELGNWNENLISWISTFETWDYSITNVNALKENGISTAKHLKIGYHIGLKTIQKSQFQDVDILFYGSLNGRRQSMIERLEKAGFKMKTLFGVYGQERDQWIARSKVILNIHYYATEIFEIVRCFYPMINAKAIVSEMNTTTKIDADYIEGIYPSHYEGIIDACYTLINNDDLRQKHERQAATNIEKIDQRLILENLLRYY